ncbi:MAG TPA: hypothetical protein VII03_04725 [Solirubrobacteraceae bacterium]
MNLHLRRHLSYANVAATLALLFAMSGGALAASHYLINSTHQINPKVLRRLKGNRGPRGPAGIRGIAIQGPSGASGAKGAKGDQGRQGPAGLSALSTLPSGESESGVYGIVTPNSATSGALKQSVSFALQLGAALKPTSIEYTPSATATTNCAGPGHAARGFLCIYSGGASGVKQPPLVFEPEDGLATPGTGRFGFTLEWTVEGANAGDVGTYTVTAP